jgi:nucleotide-binding universal stress UspA family protein
MSEARMGDFLVAYDHTDASRQATRFAAAHAARADASVDVVHVGTDLTTEEIRDAVERPFADRGVAVTVETIVAPGAEHDNVSVNDVLGEFVREHAYDLLVMGNEEHGLVHALTQASVSSHMIESQFVPVVLVPLQVATGGAVGPYLVAYHDSGAARRATTFAADHAARTGASVDVVHVGTELSTRQMRETVGDRFADQRVDVQFETLRASGSEDDNVSVSEKLSHHVADHDYELVIAGNETHGHLHSLFAGSVSDGLIDARVVPVVLVP